MADTPARRTAVALATTAALLLAGCSDDGADDAGRPARPEVPELAETWRSPMPGGVWHDLDDARGDGLWPGSDAVSVVGERTVTTYDAATGDLRATVRLGDPVCAASRDLSGSGVGVVLLGPLEDCRTVVAVDTVAGEVRWRTTLPGDVHLNDVSVGEETVAITDVRSGATRFRLSDGEALPSLGVGEAASDGTVVVVTPEGGGSTESYDVYDQDSGRLLRSLPSEADTRVEVVVSADPLVVSAYSWRDDGTYLRDLSGERPERLGRRTDAGYPHLGEHVTAGGFVAVQYGASPVVALLPAQDPSASRSLVLDPTEVLVGGYDDRLVSLTPTRTEVTGDTAVVRLTDPADPAGAADPLVLGTVPTDRSRVLLGTQAATVLGDLLVLPVGEELVAVTLPTTGPATSEVLAGDGLTAAEHTPAEAGDLCVGLSPGTLADLGFALPEHGVAASCGLHQVRPSEVALDVDSWAVLPSWEEQTTGTEGAEVAYDEAVRGDDEHALEGLEPVDGLGDEAAVDPAGTGLAIRVANVVVVVARPSGAEDTDAAAARALLLRVGGELVAELERRG